MGTNAEGITAAELSKEVFAAIVEKTEEEAKKVIADMTKGGKFFGKEPGAIMNETELAPKRRQQSPRSLQQEEIAPPSFYYSRGRDFACASCSARFWSATALCRFSSDSHSPITSSHAPVFAALALTSFSNQAYLQMQELLEKIETNAAARLTLPPGRLPTQELARYKTFLKVETHRLKMLHRAGGGGTQICRARAAILDVLLRYLWNTAKRTSSEQAQKEFPQLALVAIGGYGRAELNPHSDIDFMFLHNGRSPETARCRTSPRWSTAFFTRSGYRPQSRPFGAQH